MVKSAAATLDCFGDLSAEEREILFETFRVWQDNDASMRATADVLICHRNTVRHRLRRIEQCTGRSSPGHAMSPNSVWRSKYIAG
jgi:DNA-binding PucR family transcriptional regulator